MTFRFDKLTTKAQALVADAQARAASAGNPELARFICWWPCLRNRTASRVRYSRK